MGDQNSFVRKRQTVSSVIIALQSVFCRPVKHFHSLEELERIEEIVAMEGIDGIFVGPFDLSISMGMPGQFEHSDFCKAMDRILAACKDAGKICMTFTSTPAEATMYLAKGYDAVANSLDSIIFAKAFREMAEKIRG